MHTRYLVMIAVLLMAVTFAIGITGYFSKSEMPVPSILAHNAGQHETGNSASSPESRTALAKTPQQQMDGIVDCAALLAVHESSSKGELKEDSETYHLIGYALGKAQELAMQAGLSKSVAKTRYDEKVVVYFLAYTANAVAVASQNAVKVAGCKKQLRAYEPGGLIQSTIDKAQEMARENRP